MASIRTLASTGTLFIDFRHEGKRCREYTRLEDTPANRKKLMRLVQRLETDLAAGTFEYRARSGGEAEALDRAQLLQRLQAA